MQEGGSVGALAPYVPGSVSRPPDVFDAPELRTLLYGAGLESVVGFHNCIFNSVEEQAVAGSSPTLYMDPVLKHSPKLYHRFIKDLHSRGLIRYSRTPKGQCTVFFVRKKDTGSLRMIVDARGVNRECRSPPSVKLASPESLASIESNEETVFTATIDIQNCFHRLKMPEYMSDHFALPSVTASQVGVKMLDGAPIHPDDLIFPCCSCLPMGLSWSVFLAQGVSVRQVLLTGSQ